MVENIKTLLICIILNTSFPSSTPTCSNATPAARCQRSLEHGHRGWEIPPVQYWSACFCWNQSYHFAIRRNNHIRNNHINSTIIPIAHIYLHYVGNPKSGKSNKKYLPEKSHGCSWEDEVQKAFTLTQFEKQTWWNIEPPGIFRESIETLIYKSSLKHNKQEYFFIYTFPFWSSKNKKWTQQSHWLHPTNPTNHQWLGCWFPKKVVAYNPPGSARTISGI